MTTCRTTFRPALLLLPLLLFLGLLGIVPARGQSTNAWTSGVSGLWHNPANWSLGQAPTFTNSFVTITNFNSKVVTADATTPAANLVLRNLSIWAFQNRQNTLVLTNLAARMEVTRGLTLSNGASLLMYNSGLLVDGGLAGEMSLTSASASLQNSTLILTNGALLKIGNGAGPASLSVSGGAILAGADLRVGALSRSAGRLTLVDGTVDIGNEFTVADATGSTGAVVVVQGVLQALNTNANARIGQRGTGSMVVSNGVARFDDVSVGRQDGGRGDLLLAGGEFVSGTLSIGRFSNSVGVATVAGGRLNVAGGSLYAGREGSGTLTQTGGAILASRLFVPGATNSATGTARFSGGEAVFTGGLVVGSALSSGQLTVDGGSLYCTNAGGTGTVVVAKGALTLTSGRAQFDRLILTNTLGQLQWTGGALRVNDLVVNNGAPFVVGDGVNPATLELHGSASFAQGIIVSANATLTGCATLFGGVTVSPGGVNTLTGCSTGVTPVRLTDATLVPGGVRFSFNTDPGVSYTAEFSDGLSVPSWQAFATVAGGGGVAWVTNAPGASVGARVYRVRAP